MFIGGCAGSTACGIKIFRVQILFQFISVQLKKIIYPRGIFKIKYENNNIDEKFLASIISFIFLYIVIFFVITALLSTSGLDLTTSISAAAIAAADIDVVKSKPLVDRRAVITKKITIYKNINEIIEAKNFSSILLFSYFILNMPLG